jgi:ATP-dependent Lon protease
VRPLEPIEWKDTDVDDIAPVAADGDDEAVIRH